MRSRLIRAASGVSTDEAKLKARQFETLSTSPAPHRPTSPTRVHSVGCTVARGWFSWWCCSRRSLAAWLRLTNSGNDALPVERTKTASRGPFARRASACRPTPLRRKTAVRAQPEGTRALPTPAQTWVTPAGQMAEPTLAWQRERSAAPRSSAPLGFVPTASAAAAPATAPARLAIWRGAWAAAPRARSELPGFPAARPTCAAEGRAVRAPAPRPARPGPPASGPLA